MTNRKWLYRFPEVQKNFYCSVGSYLALRWDKAVVPEEINIRQVVRLSLPGETRYALVQPGGIVGTSYPSIAELRARLVNSGAEIWNVKPDNVNDYGDIIYVDDEEVQA
jgi:hypothetical protein